MITNSNPADRYNDRQLWPEEGHGPPFGYQIESKKKVKLNLARRTNYGSQILGKTHFGVISPSSVHNK